MDIQYAIGAVGLLLALLLLGVDIAIALGLSSLVGLMLLTGSFEATLTLAGNTMFAALNEYFLAVLVLFVLMGDFIKRSGCVRDSYVLIQRSLKGIPGRLGVATVLGNVVFAFITGSSIAAASTFSRISYPEMKRHGYTNRFALGIVAGSACLGMLIPPSALMIVWGILTEVSIGKLFLSGVLPGLILASFFILIVVVHGILFSSKHSVVASGVNGSTAVSPAAPAEGEESTARLWLSTGWIVFLILAVIGGIWWGVFTPTEAAGVGAVLSLAIAFARGMTFSEMTESILDSGRTLAPIMILIAMAILFSRMLAMSGFITVVQDWLMNSNLSKLQIFLLIIGTWVLLGMFMDSFGIMVLTVPVFAPLAPALGYDPIAFGLIGILALEVGLISPPFGLVAFAVKSSIQDEAVKVGDIFMGSMPFMLALFLLIALVSAFPSIAMYLPNLM